MEWEGAYGLTRWSNFYSGRGSLKANLPPSRISKSWSQPGQFAHSCQFDVKTTCTDRHVAFNRP